MRTLQRLAVATVGYEGRTADQLVDLVEASGINVVVDVRLTPLSRKPGLSKHRLAAGLKDAGVGYLHLPVLGNPRSNRDAYRRSEPAAQDRFRLLMTGIGAQTALEQLADCVEHESIALLCFERDPATCHRALICEALRERRPGLAFRHL